MTLPGHTHMHTTETTTKYLDGTCDLQS